MRSLRIVYSAINSEALSSLSGGIDGRPSALYIWSKIGDSSLSAASAKYLIRLSGCSLEIRSSKFTTINIVRCRRSSPRIRRFLLLHYIHHLRRTKGKYVSSVFQHPARSIEQNLRPEQMADQTLATFKRRKLIT